MPTTISIIASEQANPEEVWACFYPLDLPPTAAFFYRGRSGLTPAEHSPTIQHIVTFEAELSSQDYLIVGDERSRRYLLFGATTAHRSMTFLTLHRRQGVFTGVTAQQPDADLQRPESIAVLEGTDWRDLLTRYADMALDANQCTPPAESDNVCGYCSWYYYYQHVTESQFTENVKALSRHRTDFPCRVLQIDDGHQSHHGDWLLSSPDWPTPLRDLASSWIDQGFVPGLWLMPMLASSASRLYREHPDWFVSGTPGEPWRVAGWSPPPDDEWLCLDASRDEVIQHLTDLFQTLRAWGFRYFKLDGMGFAMPPGKRQDPGATPVSAYRAAMKAIRLAVPDAILLGCGTPYLPSLGLVDHSRVSVDTAAAWTVGGLPSGVSADVSEAPYTPCYPSLLNAVLGTLSQWWQFDRWFRADPDVVIVREEKSKLSAGEVRLSMLMAALTGVAFTSDHVGRMSEECRALLHRLTKIRVRRLRPLIWRPGRLPEAFEGEVDGRRAIVLVNLSDQEACHPLKDLPMRAPVVDLLQDQTIDREIFRLDPHDAAMLVEN